MSSSRCCKQSARQTTSMGASQAWRANTQARQKYCTCSTFNKSYGALFQKMHGECASGSAQDYATYVKTLTTMKSGVDKMTYAPDCKKQCPSTTEESCASLYIPQCKDPNKFGAGAYTTTVSGVAAVLATINDVECVIFELK